VTVIDTHGHLFMPPELYTYKANLTGSRGAGMPLRPFTVPPASLRARTDSHLALLAEARIDVQLISPRPFHLMHSEEPASMVDRWVTANNDIIAEVCSLEPATFRGVAGLPQYPNMDLGPAVRELERCITQLGFVGCVINPDPSEGLGHPPGMGEPAWYPLYEKMCELGVPGLVHSASCRSPRKPYGLHFIHEEDVTILSLLGSKVFERFPDLNLVIPHGGGSIPYQIGRWRAWQLREGGRTYDFDEALQQLWFDTVLYNKESIEFLLRMIGTARTLFATEKPGTGSSRDSETGVWLDDLVPVIESIEWLDDESRLKIFETNARALYRV
jgi:4-oxalmesaconate hydratase